MKNVLILLSCLLFTSCIYVPKDKTVDSNLSSYQWLGWLNADSNDYTYEFESNSEMVAFRLNVNGQEIGAPKIFGANTLSNESTPVLVGSTIISSNVNYVDFVYEGLHNGTYVIHYYYVGDHGCIVLSEKE